MRESKEELKSLLMKVKEESEKAGLKLNTQTTKIMASGPITSWQIDGETMEIVRDFIFLGSKITAGGACSHKIKRHLLLGIKAMKNLDSVWKSRDIILPTKVHIVKDMVFPVVMYGCESWTTKIAECRRIDAFELWCLRKLLRAPWTARRSNKSILKEIIGKSDAEAETPNTLATWCEELTDWKKAWCWERLKAEGEGDIRVTEDEVVGWHHRLKGHEFEQALRVGDSLVCCSPWGRKESNTTERLSWTELSLSKFLCLIYSEFGNQILKFEENCMLKW